MRRRLYLTAMILVIAVSCIAQISTWPITLTSSDGLPGKKEPLSHYYETSLYLFEEPFSTLRFTVVSTNTVDALGAGSYDGMSGGWGPAFPFFSLAELQLVDCNGNPIEYVATSNAVETTGDGSIANLNDGKLTTYFHSLYSSEGYSPQEYHYIDLKFEEPISGFRMKWCTRDNYAKNMPTYIGLTPGTKYLPFPEQEFSLGKQVTSVDELAEGSLFLIESNTDDYVFSDTRTITGGGFYHSPYGGHLTANAASLVSLIPCNDNNTYKVEWLNNRHYISNPGSNLVEWLQWTDKEGDAANIIFTPCEGEGAGDFSMRTYDESTSIKHIIVSDALGKMAVCVPDTLSLLSRPYKTNFTIWKADVDAGSIKFLLEEMVDESKRRIETLLDNKYYVEGRFDEDYKEFVKALTEAENVLWDKNATVAQILNSRNTLKELLIPLVLTDIYVYLDSADYILQSIEAENKISDAPNWITGTYPESAVDRLHNIVDIYGTFPVCCSYGSIDEVDRACDELKQAITEFHATEIKEIKTLPFRVGDKKEGLPGDIASYGGYVWESPFYYLSEPIDTLRFTVFQTNNNVRFGNYVIVALSEFELYDINGDKIDLTKDCFTSNSRNPVECNVLDYLCDGELPRNSSNYLSKYAGTIDFEGHVYIEVALPEPISAFKYKQYGYYYDQKFTPVDFAFGPGGVALTTDDVKSYDEYNAVLGEKITDASQITDDGIYAIQGLYSCDPVNHFVGDFRKPHFYSGTNPYENNVHPSCAFSITKTADGKYRIQSLADGKYWSKKLDADGWNTVTSTSYPSDAAELFIEPNNNDSLPGSFVIYMYAEDNVRDGKPMPYIIFQDWNDKLGAYSVTGLDANDKDGEGEWFLYKMSMDNPHYYWLSNLVTAAKSICISSLDPGCYRDLGELPTVLEQAQAAVEAKDYSNCRALVERLNAAISYMDSATPNPIYEGMYVIEAVYEAFYNSQGVGKALFVYPNGSTSDYKLYWGDAPEGDYRMASNVYQYELISARESDKVEQWVADGVITAEQANNAFYIRNLEYGVYIGGHDGLSKVVGTTAKPETVYIIRNQSHAIFDIWNPEDSGWSLHMSGHEEGSGKYGDIVYGHGLEDASQWRLRPIANYGPCRFNLTLEGENGALSGAGWYMLCSTAKVKAVPDEGYKFDGWYINGELVSTEAEYSFMIYDHINLIAKFSPVTGISVAEADGLKIYASGGALVIDSNIEITIAVYSTNGRLVKRLQVAVGRNRFAGFEKGVYVVNGVKIMIGEVV
ncbi:MAG: hypothetical protein IKU35_10320 [Bacteroidaceae bacterium]|nr:hypothetical protein [Bacteroidaceae bacterium]